MKITKEQLEKAMLTDKLTYKEIAKQFNVSIGTVIWYVEKYQIPRPLKSKIYPSKEELYKLYFIERTSIDNICKMHHIARTTIKRLFCEYGFETRAVGTNQNRSWTYEEVKQLFKDNGCELLENEYKNANTPMNYKCSCGNIAKIRLSCFNKGQRCYECRNKKLSEVQRFSFDDVKKVFDERKTTLLSTEYRGVHHKLKYICPKCGEIAYMTFSNFRRGYGCANCKKLQLKGANNPNYNPNLTDYDRRELGRYEDSYKAFRRAVFARDKKCVVCGATKNKVVHHLDGYAENQEKRTDINNAVTLCEDCHKDFHRLYKYGKNTEEQFKEYLKEKEAKSNGKHNKI